MRKLKNKIQEIIFNEESDKTISDYEKGLKEINELYEKEKQKVKELEAQPEAFGIGAARELHAKIEAYETLVMNKELCDELRDVVLKSPCTILEGYEVLKDSKNLVRDGKIIKELRCLGVNSDLIMRTIKIVNDNEK